MFAFAGPGYLVAVGYMDPGNWATDLAGGSRYGYTLLSVIMLSNLMAILLQALALRLGIASGRDLAQACRDHYSRPTTIVLWLLCELAIAACDLAEVIGSAIALNLLFGLPLMWGVCLTALDVLLVLYLQQFQFRYVEALVVAADPRHRRLVRDRALAGPAGSRRRAAAASCPQPEIVSQPGHAVHRGRHPRRHRDAAQPVPALVDHSDAQVRRHAESKREAVRFATIDSTVALMSALFLNGAILVVAAATFHGTGHEDVADISDAYLLLAPLLGTQLASTLFALALLFSGQNATLTGTLAGQIVMEGFLNIRLRPWLRRLITRLIAIVPALITVYFYGEHGTGAAHPQPGDPEPAVAVCGVPAGACSPATGARWASSSRRAWMVALAWPVAVLIAV